MRGGHPTVSSSQLTPLYAIKIREWWSIWLNVETIQVAGNFQPLTAPSLIVENYHLIYFIILIWIQQKGLVVLDGLYICTTYRLAYPSFYWNSTATKMYGEKKTRKNCCKFSCVCMRWKILVYIGKVFELCACPDDGPVQVLHNLIHHFFSLLLVCLLLVCFFF